MQGSVENIKKSKNTIFELLITTVLISVGINIFALGISNFLGVDNNIVFILVGSLLIIISLFIIFFRQLNLSNRKEHIEAALVYDAKNNKIISIKDYELSRDIEKYLESAISEDKNIEAIWKKDKLGFKDIKKKCSLNNSYSRVSKSSNFSIGISESSLLMNNILEYIILKKLSLWTTDYFNKPYFKKEKVIKICREDINDFVASNVFVNLFSKSPSERISFNNEDISNNVVFAYGENGAIYDKFELYIPQNCTLSKENPNSIILKHPFFKLKITPNFTAFGEVLPSSFERQYMKIEDFSCVHSYKIMIDIELKFSFLALFMNKSQYYNWIDEFVNKLTEYASIKYFFKKINWDIVRAILICK